MKGQSAKVNESPAENLMKSNILELKIFQECV